MATGVTCADLLGDLGGEARFATLAATTALARLRIPLAQGTPRKGYW